MGKPLFKTSLRNIENITISNDDMVKLEFNDVKFAFNIFIRIDDDKKHFKEEQRKYIFFGIWM